jgi:hypothetical protein
MANMEAEQPQDDINMREGRSPGFPFLNLQQALERARALRKASKGGEVRLSTAGSVWELGLKSSALRQTAAALKHYGLIDYLGSGEDRKVKLTDTANRIILDERPESPDRDSLIKKVALTPKLHAELWKKWGADLPPDVEMRSELILERGFSQAGALDAVAIYKGTLAFAKLSDADKMPDEEPDKLDTSASQANPDRSKITPIQGQKSSASAISERIVYKPGYDISVGFSMEPDIETYEFLRDYLDFRITRMKKQQNQQ